MSKLFTVRSMVMSIVVVAIAFFLAGSFSSPAYAAVTYLGDPNHILSKKPLLNAAWDNLYAAQPNSLVYIDLSSASGYEVSKSSTLQESLSTTGVRALALKETATHGHYTVRYSDAGMTRTGELLDLVVDVDVDGNRTLAGSGGINVAILRSSGLQFASSDVNDVPGEVGISQECTVTLYKAGTNTIMSGNMAVMFSDMDVPGMGASFDDEYSEGVEFISGFTSNYWLGKKITAAQGHHTNDADTITEGKPLNVDTKNGNVWIHSSHRCGSMYDSSMSTWGESGMRFTWRAVGAATIMGVNTGFPDPVKKKLSVKKSLSGGVLHADDFTFTLTEETPAKYRDGYTMPDSTTATNKASGNVVFDAISFKKPGVYTFSIAERASGDDYMFAKNTVTATVTVVGEGSKLVADVEYSPDDREFFNVTAPPSPTKQVDKTYAEVGDTVTYTVIQKAYPGWVYSDLAFKDTIPDNLSIESVKILDKYDAVVPTSAYANESSGQSLKYVFDNASWLKVNADMAERIKFVITCKVKTAAAGSKLSNYAETKVNSKDWAQTNTVNTTVPIWYVKLKKTTSNANAEPTNLHSISGGKYEMSNSVNGEVKTYTISNSSGEYDFTVLHAGTYYFREVQPPMGHTLSNAVVSVALNASNDSLTSGTHNIQTATFNNTAMNITPVKTRDKGYAQVGEIVTYEIKQPISTVGISEMSFSDAIPGNTTYVPSSFHVFDDTGNDITHFAGSLGSSTSTLTYTFNSGYMNGMHGVTGNPYKFTFQVLVNKGAAGTQLKNKASIKMGNVTRTTGEVTTDVPKFTISVSKNSSGTLDALHKVAGATYEVYDAAGTVYGQISVSDSDGDGVATGSLTVTNSGTYYVREVLPPMGHTKSTAIRTVTFAADATTSTKTASFTNTIIPYSPKKVRDKAYAEVGEVVTYDVTQAISTVGLSSLEFSDAVPANTEYVPSSFAVYDPTGNDVTHLAGTLSTGSSLTYTFNTAYLNSNVGYESGSFRFHFQVKVLEGAATAGSVKNKATLKVNGTSFDSNEVSTEVPKWVLKVVKQSSGDLDTLHVTTGAVYEVSNEAGSVIGRLTTAGSESSASMTVTNSGTYSIREIVPPRGHRINTDVVTVPCTSSNKGQTLTRTFTNTSIPYKPQKNVDKPVADVGEVLTYTVTQELPLAGLSTLEFKDTLPVNTTYVPSSFVVLDNHGADVTNLAGALTVSGRSLSYKFRAGYLQSNAGVDGDEFSFSFKATVDRAAADSTLVNKGTLLINNVSFETTPATTRVTGWYLAVQKRSSDAAHMQDGVHSLKGAKYLVMAPDGTEYTTITTDDQGKASCKIYEPGTYKVKEILPPPGHRISNEEQSATFNRDNDGETLSMTFTNELVPYGPRKEVNKTSAYIGDILTYDVTQEIPTQGVSSASFKDVIPANTTYVSRSFKVIASNGSDVTAQAGTFTASGRTLSYVFNTSYLQQNVGYDGNVFTFTFQVSIDRDAADSDLVNTADVVINDHTFTTNPVTTRVPGWYLKVQKKSSNAAGMISGVHSVAGALYKVYLADGTEIETLMTGTDGSASCKIYEPGTYFIKEVLPPLGHRASDEVQSVTFNANNDSQTITKTFVNELVPYDPKKAVNKDYAGVGEVLNYEITQEIPTQGVSSAVFRDTIPANTTYVTKSMRVIDADGANVTDIAGDFVQSGRTLTYTFRESYLARNVGNNGVAFRFSFQVRVEREAADSVLVNKADVVVNDHTFTTEPVTTRVPGWYLTIQKQSDNSDAMINGVHSVKDAVYQVYFPDGTEYTTLTTDAQGKTSCKIYEAGTYLIRELTPPMGHRASDEVQSIIFSNTNDGQTITKTFVNEYVEYKPHKEVTKDYAGVGETLRYDITQEIPTQGLSSAVFKDTLPVNTTYVNKSFSVVDGDGSDVTAIAGTLDISGRNITYTFNRNYLARNINNNGIAVHFSFSVTIDREAADSVLHNTADIVVNNHTFTTNEVTTRVPGWYLTIQKQSDNPNGMLEGIHSLKGAVYQLSLPDGTEIDRLTTGDDGTVSRKIYDGGEYLIRELLPPPGHRSSDEVIHVTFGRGNDGQMTTTPFVNEWVEYKPLKAVNKDYAEVGETLTYDVTQELPTQYVNSIVFKDTLPENTSYVSRSFAVIGAGGQDVTHSAGILEVSGRTITYTFKKAYLDTNVGHDGVAFRFTFQALIERDASDSVLHNTADIVVNDKKFTTNEVTTRVPGWYVRVYKRSGDPSTLGDSVHSLKGAQYLISNAAGDTIDTLETDDAGTDIVQIYNSGTYYMSETLPPPGHRGTSEVKTIALGRNNDGQTVYPTFVNDSVPYGPYKAVDKAYAEVGEVLTYTVVQELPTQYVETMLFRDDIPANTSYVPDSFKVTDSEGRNLTHLAGTLSTSGGSVVYRFNPLWVNNPTGYNGVQFKFTFQVKVERDAADSIVPNTAHILVNSQDYITNEVMTRVPAWYVHVKKNSDYPDLLDGNSLYGLKGAVFEIRDMSDVLIGTLTTDADGRTDVLQMIHGGSYWMVEVVPPAGHALAEPNRQKFTLSRTNDADTMLFAFENEAAKAPIEYIAMKTDRDYYFGANIGEAAEHITGTHWWQGNQVDFSQTKVRVDFYGSRMYTGQPLASAVFQADAQGRIAFANATPVDNTTWRYRFDGKNIMPLGYVRVTEVAEPQGYNIDNTPHEARIVQTTGAEWEVLPVRNWRFIDVNAIVG